MVSMQERIEKKLNDHFHPTILRVVNESYKHTGHSGDDGSGESHFYVEICAEILSGLSRVAAQRSVYDVLKSELETVHALSLHIKK